MRRFLGDENDESAVVAAHGELDNLKLIEDYPMPQAVEGHVVIRVRASSFNYHDLFTVKGMPGIRVPLPVVIVSTCGRDHRVGRRCHSMEDRRSCSGESGQ